MQNDSQYCKENGNSTAYHGYRRKYGSICYLPRPKLVNSLIIQEQSIGSELGKMWSANKLNAKKKGRISHNSDTHTQTVNTMNTENVQTYSGI